MVADSFCHTLPASLKCANRLLMIVLQGPRKKKVCVSKEVANTSNFHGTRAHQERDKHCCVVSLIALSLTSSMRGGSKISELEKYPRT